MPRTIAIGDIHGCFTALDQLLTAIKPTTDDRIITLGDYVDRGPDSRGVIERLLKLQSECNLVTLRGNHEWMMLRGLQDDASERDFWLTYGGQETLDSYGGSPEAIPRTHLDFLEATLPYFETATHIFLHANYEPTVAVEDQTELRAMWTHLAWDAPEPHVSGKTVVVGHTPQLSGRIRDDGHLVCIDTCCYGGGWLTALDIESGELWQVTASGHLR